MREENLIRSSVNIHVKKYNATCFKKKNMLTDLTFKLRINIALLWKIEMLLLSKLRNAVTSRILIRYKLI